MNSISSVLISEHGDISKSKGQLIEILLRENLKYTNDTIQKILSLQFKHELKGEYLSIGDILFKSSKISQKFVTKKNLFEFFVDKGIPLRLGEQLLINGYVSEEDYELLVNDYCKMKRVDNNILFGDVLLSDNVMSPNDLLIFLEQNKFRLRVGEILISMGLIDDNELKDLLKLQQEKRNHVQLVKLLNESKKGKFASFLGGKNDYIDHRTLEEIIIKQRLSAKKMHEFQVTETDYNSGLEVDETYIDEETKRKFFGNVSSFKQPSIAAKTVSDDIFCNEPLHSAQRRF